MFELRDKIRELDFATDMKFDLLGLYEMSELTDAEKKLMATIIHNAENEEKAAEEVFEILNIPNAVNMDEDCDSTLTEDVKEEIQDGDEIVYNGEHLFVTNADYMDLGKWLWVTDNEEDRYNKKASGWSLAKELVDEVIGQPEDDDEQLDESLKDFMFTVKCNDGPKELIKVVAEDKAKAEEYAKKMYAQNHTTYADDRHNVWSIDEDLSSDIDKVKHAVDRFKGQVTVSKDSENDVGQYLLSKNISYMKDDSKSAKGKLTFMLKYPIPKLLNKNENLSGNCLDEAMDSSKFDKLLDKAFEFGYNYGYSDTFEDFMKKVKPNVKQSLTKDMLIRLKDAFDNGNHEGDVDEEMPLTEGAEGYYKEEDGLENATQEYTSANTSINSAKLPAIFSMVNFKPETINLDYGGGKFDNATTALEGKGVTNLIYDPYNRSSGHNKDVIDTVRKNGGADTVTCSNVLNVIKEPEARKAVIKNIYSLLKSSGTAYFTVYEGTGKGNEGPTKSGYQLNKKTGDYVEEISSVFPSVSRRGKLIIASKGTSITEEFDDDWSDTLETGGEPTYCPDCGVKFVRDEEGDAICPKCNKTPYQLANERRKNESLNENDTKYTATGRKRLVSDEIMSLAVEAARTIDPNAKRDYDDDFIYGDDGHGGSTWAILLNGDGKAYSTSGRNAVLTSKVEKAVNDAADAYWADFDKRWEENNKYLTAKGIKESCSNNESVIRYPNGMEVTDVDLDRALDYQYGTDRDMDNSKYTDEEKQRAVTYWINKTNPNPYTEAKVSEEATQYLSAEELKKLKAFKDDSLKESLNKDELEELFKLCNQLGIHTLGDLELFMKNEGKGKAILSALKDYLFFEIGDPDFQAKDESLKESKADIDNFINKFGKDSYELFKKSTQRMKNRGISTDLTYHVKNTDKKDLDAILLNLQNRAITKDGDLTELAGDYEYLGEDKGYKVYKINDVIASINFGAGTGWCISGRYGHYGEKNYKPTRAEAEKHWNDYTSRGVQFYFFIGTKDKVALALYPNTFTPDTTTSNIFINKTNCEIYNEQDKLDYSLFSSLPVDLINEHIIFEGIQAENGLYIKDNVLVKCDNSIKNVVIPDGITKIADKAFALCEQLKTVTIPNSVTNIGNWAFSTCSSLTSITIGSSVTSIGNGAFSWCYSLTSITIGSSVTSIGDYAFTHCSSLTSITIPNSVTNIGNWAFYDCTKLKNIMYKGTIAEWKDTLQWRGWEEEVPKSCTIHCTDGDISLSGKKETAKSAKDELLKESDDPHYLKEAKEKLTTYYQIWAKGPSDSKFHFQDEYEYLSDLVEEAKGFMHGNAQVRVLEVEEDESGNVVKRNGEVLFYSDGAVQTVDKELFDVATPQETADMFGKKVYSKKENKLYTPTGPVFEAAKSSPEQKVERELKKLDDTKDESLKEDNDAEEWEEVKPNIESKDGSVNESLASRQADTDAQEKSIIAIENTLDSLGIKVHYGTKIGKYPQTVILDIKYQDNAIYIISDGKVLINGDYEGEVNPKDKEAVKQMLIEYEFIDDDSVTESKNESLKESDDSQFDKAVEAMKAYWNYQMSLEQLHNTLLKIYNNDAEKAFKVFAEYGDAARRSKDESLKEDNDAEEWEEVASKSVEDSDGFLTDYVWYTDGNKHVFIFGDSDIYRPEDGYFDWEVDIVEGKEAEAYKEAQDWFNSYNGFAEELDEAQDIYDIQGQAVRDARRKEVLDEFKEIFTDEPGGINLDNEETLAIVRGYLEDMGYVVEVSETQNASHPIHIEWFK